MEPADAGEEQHRGERGRVHQRRPEVGLQEHEHHRRGREPDRCRDRAQPADPVLLLDEVAGDRNDEERLAELGRLELERPELDPALRPADGLREDEDEDHQRDRAAVDDAPVAPVERWRGEDRDHEPGSADRGRDRLSRDEVARVAWNVESGDAGDRPQAVADERGDREQQHEVEPSDEGRDIDRVARPERDPLATGVDDHRSATTFSPSPRGSGSRP